MSRYAEGTTTSIEKTQAEIHQTVKRFGADAFSSGYQDGRAFCMFRAHSRFIRLTTKLADKTDAEFATDGRGHTRSWEKRAEAAERENMRRWRGLAALVKAKLAAVDDGVVEFEQEFLAHVVMPDNATVWEHAKPIIEQTYLSGQVTPLLPPPR